MIPQKVLQVLVFSQTPNGKLDRRALVAMPLPKETSVSVASTPSTKCSFLVRLVLRVLKESRGITASPSSSFASVGIDSIGGIFFIRAPSDSLGGVAISPGELYTPGTTVTSFANKLQLRIATERPELLPDLEVFADDKTSSCFVRDLEDSDEVDQEGGISTGRMHFVITSNLRLLQGLRGLLTLMVLCDHFTTLKYDFAILADTSLFVILTGISTALQMRDQQLIEISDYLNFMGHKCIGIFPILWITLLLHIPRLVLQFVYLDPSTSWITIAGCVALNVIAMQTNVPICAKEGPSISTYYASVIFNTFIIYGLLRYLQTRPAVNRIMHRQFTPLIHCALCGSVNLSDAQYRWQICHHTGNTTMSQFL